VSASGGGAGGAGAGTGRLKALIGALRDPQRAPVRRRVATAVVVVAVALVMLFVGMELGRGGAGDPGATGGAADGTGTGGAATGATGAASAGDLAPTGVEAVEDPEGDYSCPRGGSLAFVGTGFAPGSEVTASVEGTGEALGSFTVDADGFIAPAGDGAYPTVIIPATTAPGPLTLRLDYGDGSAGAALAIEVTANPYTADMEVIWDEVGGTAALRVTSTGGLWAPGAVVYLTLDYAESPIYGPIEVDADGDLDGLIILPEALSGTGGHTLTLPAAATTVGGVSYPEASVSADVLL
jgi:hypothetical protein